MDLNGLADFALVATNGGLGKASRASRRSKATLSRRIADLEERPDSSLVGPCFAKDRLVVVAAPSVPMPPRGKVRPVPGIVSSSFQPTNWTLDDGRLVLEPIPRLRLSSFLM